MYHNTIAFSKLFVETDGISVDVKLGATTVSGCDSLTGVQMMLA